MEKKLTQKFVKRLVPETEAFEVMDSEIKGLTLRVLPSGTKTYYVRYRFSDGRRYRVKIGRAEHLQTDDARTRAKAILGDVAKGQNPAVERKREGVPTLRAFLKKHYRPWAEQNLRSGNRACRRIETCFSSFLDKSMEKLSPFILEKWRTERRKDNKSVATINRDIGTLKAALTKAVEWEFIPIHPLAGVKLAREDHLRRVRYLTEPEEAALFTALDEHEESLRRKRRSGNEWRHDRAYDLFPDLDKLPFADHLRPMIILAMNTGIRRGEMFALRWDSIDFDCRNLTVEGSNAKSGRTRHIPLNDNALEMLVKWRSQCGSGELVFTSKNGKQFDNVQKAWESLLDSAGISDFRWHDLRHDFASRLVMAGVDLNTVRELLGHSDMKMTLRYAHLAPEHKAKAVALLAANRKVKSLPQEKEDAACA